MPINDAGHFHSIPSDFYEIAKRPTLYQEYDAFLTKLYCDENLRFVEACKAGVSIDKICQNFLVKEAQTCINVSDARRQDALSLATQGNAGAPEDLFSDCIREAVTLIDSAHGQRFASDPRNYPKYLEEEFGAEIRARLGVTPAQMPSDVLIAVFKTGSSVANFKETAKLDNRDFSSHEAGIVASNEARVMRILQDAGIHMSPEDVQQFLSATISPQAEEQRVLRRLLKVPDEQAVAFQALCDSAHEDTQGDQTRENARFLRQQEALADLHASGRDGPDPSKVLNLTQQMAKAKGYKKEVDALRAANGSQKDIRAAMAKMAKSKIALAQVLEQLGLSPGPSMEFVDAYASGAPAAITKIMPDCDVFSMLTDEDKAALENAYSRDALQGDQMMDANPAAQPHPDDPGDDASVLTPANGSGDARPIPPLPLDAATDDGPPPPPPTQAPVFQLMDIHISAPEPDLDKLDLGEVGRPDARIDAALDTLAQHLAQKGLSQDNARLAVKFLTSLE